MLSFPSWIASQHCNSWTWVPIVYPSGKNHQSVVFFLTWTPAAGDFIHYNLPRNLTLFHPTMCWRGNWRSQNPHASVSATARYQMSETPGAVSLSPCTRGQVRTRSKQSLWPGAEPVISPAASSPLLVFKPTEGHLQSNCCACPAPRLLPSPRRPPKPHGAGRDT